MGLINKNKAVGQECMYLIATGALESNVPVAPGLLKRPHTYGHYHQDDFLFHPCVD